MAFVNLLDIIYPVGSIYISTNDLSPSNLIGGSWTQVNPGTFLCAAGDGYQVLSNGGSESSSHTHSAQGYLAACITPNSQGAGRTYYKTLGTSYTSSWSISAGTLQSTSSVRSEGVYINGSVEHKTIDTIPPYLAVNIWRRVS